MISSASKNTKSIPELTAHRNSKARIVLVACACALMVLLPRGLEAQQTDAASARISPDAPARSQTSGALPVAGPLQYFIAPDDLLEIDVMDVAELSREYRVGPDGAITIPLLSSSIVAQGLTPEQLAAVISDRLRMSGLVSKPHVVVAVKSSRVHSVAILGAVRRPQIYPVFGTTTLLDIISQAEGLADDAGNSAIVTRGDMARQAAKPAGNPGDSEAANTQSAVEKVDLKKLMESGDPALNLTIYPGDRVTVERAGIVYVVGAVNRPGGFTLRSDHEEMTVLKAVALGEGLSSTARAKDAMIIRQGPQIPGGREEIAVNLSNVVSGRAPDQRLRPNDILFVPDSASKRALRRGAEAAIQIATGIIIFRR
jgi:polysaccharide biosynthesis/export protein